MIDLPITNKTQWEFRNPENYILKSSNNLIMEAIFSTYNMSITNTHGSIGNFTCHKLYKGEFMDEGIQIYWHENLFE